MYDMDCIRKTMDNLKKNNMDAVFLENKNDLPKLLSQYLKDGDEVTFGGSMTLFETGVMDYLKDLDAAGRIRLLDRNAEGNTADDVAEIYREAFCSDVYFTSSNAVTQNGYLYNVDGNGNRIAAMIFGPKSVIVIVGYNKLVATKEEAMERVQKIAAPKNAMRLHMNTPCAKTGECMHCMSEDRICCNYTFFGKQRTKNRIKVVILGEEYGY
jgi:L-lactate utilization protein LutB